MAKVIYRNRAYLLLTIGYLCITINLYINGIGILLPTFLGYILMAKASYILRDKIKIFNYAVIPSVTMAVLTLPLLTTESISWIDFLFWPMQILEYSIIIIHFIGIYQCSVLGNAKKIKTGLVAFVIVLLAFRILWFYSAKLDTPQSQTFVIYEIPKLLFTYILYLCYKHLT